jgi:acyl dehydratase
MSPESDAALSQAPADIGALVGRRVETSWSWEPRDVLLYALGVGAGQRDPALELELTTESSEGLELRAVPTFGVLMTHAAGELLLQDLDQTLIVHAEQALRVDRPIPVAGSARVSAEVESVYDKGSGALLTNRAVVVDEDSGEELLAARSAVFVRGAGGFGGERGPSSSSSWQLPDRAADHALTAEVRPDQALLYRLSGDRNPLHCDPAFARRAGFRAPILHGLATYGIAARLLFGELCATDPNRFRSIQARFSAPVEPGGVLRVDAWEQESAVLFQVRDDTGTVVLDRGCLERSV